MSADKKTVSTSNFNTRNAVPKVPGHAEKGSDAGEPGEGDGIEPGSNDSAEQRPAG